MQPEVYHLDNLSIVPVEGLATKELFQGIEGHDQSDKTKEIILRRLQRLIPAYIDDAVLPGRFQCPNFFAKTHYDVSLPHGMVHAVVKNCDDLGRYILSEILTYRKNEAKQREEIQDKFNGQSGVVIHADYRWNGNERKGLQLGRFSEYLCMGSSRNAHTFAFQRAINALCQRAELTDKTVCDNQFLLNPLSYQDEWGEIDASMRDLSLAAIRAADQPIGEFMAWMQENAVQVNTMGELVRLSLGSHLSANKYKQMAEQGQVSATLSERVREEAIRYFKLAQEAYAELHPPRNNRMDYLVH